MNMDEPIILMAHLPSRTPGARERHLVLTRNRYFFLTQNMRTEAVQASHVLRLFYLRHHLLDPIYLSSGQKNPREACGAHDELTYESPSLQLVPRRLKDEVAKVESLVNRLDDSCRDELQFLVVGCQKVSKTLEYLIDIAFNGESSDIQGKLLNGMQ